MIRCSARPSCFLVPLEPFWTSVGTSVRTKKKQKWFVSGDRGKHAAVSKSDGTVQRLRPLEAEPPAPVTLTNICTSSQHAPPPVNAAVAPSTLSCWREDVWLVRCIVGGCPAPQMVPPTFCQRWRFKHPTLVGRRGGGTPFRTQQFSLSSARASAG